MIFTKIKDGQEYAIVMGDDQSTDIFLIIKDKLNIKLTQHDARALSVYLGCASINSSLREDGHKTTKLYHEQESQPNQSDSAKQE